MKKPKTNRKIAHTSRSPKGMGDFYGQAIPAKLGKLRDVFTMESLPSKKLRKPPKSLA